MTTPRPRGPSSLVRRVVRRVARRAGVAGLAGGTLGRDAFAAFRSVDGPTLVDVASVTPDPEPAGHGRLVVLVPSLMPDRLTGGPNTALQLGARVAALGVPVRFVSTHGGVDAIDVLRAHVAGLIGRPVEAIEVTFEAAHGHAATLPIRRGDVAMATWWPTAYLAERTLAASGRPDFLYLVQDFEPAFYPWSTNYALVMRTYAMAARPIFNTALLRDHFVLNGIGRPDVAATSFEPAVDASLFRRRPSSGPRRLLFYARPGKPRNAFELGLRALRVAVAAGAFEGKWEFAAIGEPIPDLPLGKGLVLRATPWRSYADYAALLGESDVLLSLMLSPHPSYPPLEMAAAGGEVVTNTFGVKTAAALQQVSPRIHAVEPEVDALAAALAQAARLPRDGAEVASHRPTSWAESLGPVAEWVVATSF